MNHRRLIHTAIAIGASTASLVLCAAPAAAKDTKRICTPAFAAYKSALVSEKAEHLREARALLTTCMESTCGSLVPKCTAKFNQIGATMPSVVPIISDNSGTPLVDVQVRMDGELLTSHLDGRGLPVEPGAHEFSFSTDKGVVATQKVMIVDGQRNRPVSVSTRPEGAQTRAPERPEAPPAAPEKAGPDAVVVEKSEKVAPVAAVPEGESSAGRHWALPRSVGPYLVAGVGVAAVGAGALLTVWGNKDNDQAVAQCHGNCPQSTVEHIKTLYLAADVAFGAGAVGLAVATWLFASSRSAEDKVPPRAVTAFDVRPIRSGALASISGAF